MIPYCILVIADESDRDFMSQLFQDYHRLMYHEIMKLTHDSWPADDVLQSTLVKLIDKIPLLQTLDRNRLVNYIISASKNTAITYLQREKRRAVFSFDDCQDSGEDFSDFDSLELHLETEEDEGCLRRVWSHLDDRSKYLLEGRYILKKAPEENTSSHKDNL